MSGQVWLKLEEKKNWNNRRKGFKSDAEHSVPRTEQDKVKMVGLFAHCEQKVSNLLQTDNVGVKFSLNISLV